MTGFESTVWTRMVIPAALVLVVQVAITQVQRDLGMPVFSAAHAQEDAKKPERETRRTPALRNKVYEKLSAAQAPGGDPEKAEKAREAIAKLLSRSREGTERVKQIVQSRQ